MLRKIRQFLVTTLIGGLLVLLPITIFVLLVRFVFNIITNLIRPVAALFGFIENPFLVQVVSLSIVIAFCFFVGLAVRTRSGKALFTYFERRVLERLPFYNTIRGTVQQVFENRGTSFSQVVLIEVFGGRMIGFVTSESETGIYTVFVPTAPNPTNGFIFHSTADRLEFLDVAPEDAMRTVIGVGTGANVLFDFDKRKAAEEV
ncbi:MAG: DUF502 domain-containing protein [Bacteroidota bacterium]